MLLREVPRRTMSIAPIIVLGLLGCCREAAAQDVKPRQLKDSTAFTLQLSSPILDAMRESRQEPDGTSAKHSHPLNEKSVRVDLDMGIASGDRRVYDFSLVGTGSIVYNQEHSRVDPVARLKLSLFLFPTEPRVEESNWYGPYLTTRGEVDVFGSYAGDPSAGRAMYGIASAGIRYPVIGAPFAMLELGYRVAYDRIDREPSRGLMLVLGGGTR